ncbi:wHTH domain-containing protein [Streptomyces sp. NPDC001220]
MVLPQRATELDRDLFRYDDLFRNDTDDMDERYGPWWFWLSPDDEIPFFLLVLAARDLGRRPRELAARLSSYGLRVSHDDLPQDLAHRDALRLLTVDENAKFAWQIHIRVCRLGSLPCGCVPITCP